MIEAVKHITEVLRLPDIAFHTGDKTFWSLAEPDTPRPFINFSVREDSSASKNGIYNYSTEVRIYGKTLTEVCTIAETVRDTINVSAYRWHYRGMGPGEFTDPEGKEAFITINFEFKL